MTENLSSHLSGKEFHKIEAGLSLRKIIHGDEGMNHWTDLYEVADSRLACGSGCGAKAQFLFYEHYHDNTEQVTLSCAEHCPQTYLVLLESKTAA